MRLDLALVERGLAASRTNAAALIAEGRVSVSGREALKPGLKVTDTEEITVTAGRTPDFASRAGQKLYGALEDISDLDVEGMRCLDAGASTGGFTDVLLRAGASRVVAVDVGHDQLVTPLREDPRVDVYEGLNVRHLTSEMIGGPVDLTVADLSFISLTLVLEPLVEATRPGGQLLLMIKPQFEIGRAKLGSGGVVRDPEDRRSTVESVLEKAESLGLILLNLSPSALPGQEGNREYFARWLRPEESDGEASGTQAAGIDRRAALEGLRTSGAFED